MSETFWFGRNSEGKLNKKVFENVTDYPVQQEVKLMAFMRLRWNIQH